MKELEDKMCKAIAMSTRNVEAAEKCAEIAKQYTLKILDGMAHFKDKDGDRVYTNLVKTRMAVQAGEI